MKKREKPHPAGYPQLPPHPVVGVLATGMGGGNEGKHSQLQDSQVGFQIIGILLGLCLHIALQGGQILRIVPRVEEKQDG